jgi:surface-adhesin protein E
MLILALLLSTGLHVQKKWTDIGTTAAGNHVFVDPKSVKRAGNLVTATVRVVFTTPVKTASGTWMSSRTVATFDCAAKKLAAKENVYYGDAKETKIVEKKVNAQPGYGVALGGTMGAVAMQYLCSAK